MLFLMMMNEQAEYPFNACCLRCCLSLSISLTLIVEQRGGHCLSSLWLPRDWKQQGSSALLSMVREKCQLLSGVVLVGLENSMSDPLQPAQQWH